MKTSAEKSNKKRVKKGTFTRLIKTLFGFYPVMLPLTVVCIIFSAAVGAMPSIFMQKVIGIIEQAVVTGDWTGWKGQVFSAVAVLAVLYILSLVSSATYNQFMAFITQGSLKKMRVKMFHKMQDLPVKYFDSNNHGDIMSRYTNDIDTLRQLVSQSMPQLLISGITIITLFCIMMYFCLWLALVVLTGVTCMFFVTRFVGGNSAKHFFR